MTDQPTIKERKEAFVSGLTGGTVWEVYVCTFIAVSSYAAWCILQSKLAFFTNRSARSGTSDSKKKAANLAPFLSLATLVDVALNWLSMLLSITVYSSQPLLLNLFVLGPAIVVWLSNKYDQSLLSPGNQQEPSDEKKNFKSKDQSTQSQPESDQTSLTSLIKTYLPRQSFLTVYRGQMMVITCLAILAVDFPIFPRRFAKVETWGTSIMDLGVGSFVFSMGLVSSRSTLIAVFGSQDRVKQPSFFAAVYKSCKQALTVLLLGVVRLLSVKSLDYQEHVTEYGVHWNFFVTLGLLPPVVTVLDYMFPARRAVPALQAPEPFKKNAKGPEPSKKKAKGQAVSSFVVQIVKLPLTLITTFFSVLAYIARNGVPTCVLALSIAVLYEICLDRLGLVAWIITAPRTDLLSQNKEGVCSFIGYLSIFLFGKATGYYVLPEIVTSHQLLYPQTKSDFFVALRAPASADKKASFRRRKIGLLLCASAVLHGLYFVCRAGLRLIVSRRFANLPYVLWVSSYNTLNLAFFMLAEYLFFGGRPDAYPYEARVPASVDAINASGLFVFLLANVSTGLVNMSVNTLDASPQQSVAVLGAYAAMLYLVGMVLKKKGITIRL